MKVPAPVLRVWVLLGILAAVIVGVMAGPLGIAWRSYDLYANGVHAGAEIVEKVGGFDFQVRIASGPRTGHECRVSPSAAIYDAKEVGDLVAVVIPPDEPDDCLLEATLEASGLALAVVAGMTGMLLLLLASVGVFVHRSYREADVTLTSHLDVDAKDMTCPSCGAEMAEGYVAVLAGLHWRAIDEPIGMPHALSGLPGTVGWRGRPRLHGYRCDSCCVVTFKYGKTA